MPSTKSKNYYSDFREQLSQNFTGRDWLFSIVESFLGEPEQKKLIIAGETGIGKSAFVSSLIDKYQPAAYHFCISRYASSKTPRSFVENLARQLAKNIPQYAKQLLADKDRDVKIFIDLTFENIQGDITGVHIENFQTEKLSPLETFERLIIKPLKNLDDKNELPPFFIVVDSLDEAATIEGDNIIDILLEAEDLPDKVKFVLTSRPEKKILDRFRNYVLIESDSEGNLSDIREYIEKMEVKIPSFQKKLSEIEINEVEFLDLVVKASNGNFLYCQWLLNSLITEKRDFQDLYSLPRGLEGIYLDFLRARRNKLDPEWRTKYLPVLGVLCAAQEPISKLSLQNLSFLTKQELFFVIQDIEEFLNPITAKEGKYQVWHQSFVDFLQSEEKSGEFWIDVLQVHSGITSFYLDSFSENWDECDDYGLSNLITHLKETENKKSIIELLLSQTFCAEKQNRLGLDNIFREIEDLLESDFINSIDCYLLTIRYRKLKNSFLSGFSDILEAIKEGKYDLSLELCQRQDEKDTAIAGYFCYLYYRLIDNSLSNEDKVWVKFKDTHALNEWIYQPIFLKLIKNGFSQILSRYNKEPKTLLNAFTALLSETPNPDIAEDVFKTLSILELPFKTDDSETAVQKRHPERNKFQFFTTEKVVLTTSILKLFNHHNLPDSEEKVKSLLNNWCKVEAKESIVFLYLSISRCVREGEISMARRLLKLFFNKLNLREDLSLIGSKISNFLGITIGGIEDYIDFLINAINISENDEKELLLKGLAQNYYALSEMDDDDFSSLDISISAQLHYNVRKNFSYWGKFGLISNHQSYMEDFLASDLDHDNSEEIRKIKDLITERWESNLTSPDSWKNHRLAKSYYQRNENEKLAQIPLNWMNVWGALYNLGDPDVLKLDHVVDLKQLDYLFYEFTKFNTSKFGKIASIYLMKNDTPKAIKTIRKLVERLANTQKVKKNRDDKDQTNIEYLTQICQFVGPSLFETNRPEGVEEIITLCCNELLKLEEEKSLVEFCEGILKYSFPKAKEQPELFSKIFEILFSSLLKINLKPGYKWDYTIEALKAYGSKSQFERLDEYMYNYLYEIFEPNTNKVLHIELIIACRVFLVESKSWNLFISSEKYSDEESAHSKVIQFVLYDRRKIHFDQAESIINEWLKSKSITSISSSKLFFPALAIFLQRNESEHAWELLTARDYSRQDEITKNYFNRSSGKIARKLNETQQFIFITDLIDNEVVEPTAKGFLEFVNYFLEDSINEVFFIHNIEKIIDKYSFDLDISKTHASTTLISLFQLAASFEDDKIVRYWLEKICSWFNFNPFSAVPQIMHDINKGFTKIHSIFVILLKHWSEAGVAFGRSYLLNGSLNTHDHELFLCSIITELWKSDEEFNGEDVLKRIISKEAYFEKDYSSNLYNLYIPRHLNSWLESGLTKPSQAIEILRDNDFDSILANIDNDSDKAVSSFLNALLCWKKFGPTFRNPSFSKYYNFALKCLLTMNDTEGAFIHEKAYNRATAIKTVIKILGRADIENTFEIRSHLFTYIELLAEKSKTYPELINVGIQLIIFDSEVENYQDLSNPEKSRQEMLKQSYKFVLTCLDNSRPDRIRYYFDDLLKLRNELSFLIDNDIDKICQYLESAMLSSKPRDVENTFKNLFELDTLSSEWINKLKNSVENIYNKNDDFVEVFRKYHDFKKEVESKESILNKLKEEVIKNLNASTYNTDTSLEKFLNEDNPAAMPELDIVRKAMEAPFSNVTN